MSREDKLKRLGKLKKTSTEENGLVIMSNGKEFLEALQAKIDQVKKAFETEVLVDVNTEELVKELKSLDKLVPEIKELISSIDEINIPEIPSSIELSNASEVVKTINNLNEVIKNFKIDFPEFPKIPKKIELSGINSLTNALQDITSQVDKYDAYKPADSDTKLESMQFHGFVNRAGNWFILRQVNIGAENQESKYRFATGKKDYETAWLERQKHKYVLYSEVKL